MSRPTRGLNRRDFFRLGLAAGPAGPVTRVGDVMIERAELQTVRPDEPLGGALERMSREDINQFPVTEDERFLGMVSRDRVLNFLQTRGELSMWSEHRAQDPRERREEPMTRVHGMGILAAAATAVLRGCGGGGDGGGGPSPAGLTVAKAPSASGDGQSAKSVRRLPSRSASS